MSCLEQATQFGRTCWMHPSHPSISARIILLRPAYHNLKALPRLSRAILRVRNTKHWQRLKKIKHKLALSRLGELISGKLRHPRNPRKSQAFEPGYGWAPHMKIAQPDEAGWPSYSWKALLLLTLRASLLRGKTLDPAIATFLVLVTVIHETHYSGTGE
jgi:hypothetical protein